VGAQASERSATNQNGWNLISWKRPLETGELQS
jgi:hypothetical protein